MEARYLKISKIVFLSSLIMNGLIIAFQCICMFSRLYDKFSSALATYAYVHHSEIVRKFDMFLWYTRLWVRDDALLFQVVLFIISIVAYRLYRKLLQGRQLLRYLFTFLLVIFGIYLTCFLLLCLIFSGFDYNLH